MPIAAYGASPFPRVPNASAPPILEYEGTLAYKDQIVIKYVKGISQNERETISYAYGVDRTLRSDHALGIFLIEKTDEKADYEFVLNRLRSDPAVLWAHPNYKGELSFVPNDTSFGEQWHLRNTVNPEISLGAEHAWDITTGDGGRIVAVVDTGIANGLASTSHPEFQGRLLAGRDIPSDDSIPDDDHGHGTAVAGALAANANNGHAVSGVDHGVKILPVKWFDSDLGGGSFQAASAIQWAVDHDPTPDVINMSFQFSSAPSIPELEEAIANARNKGIILIASAGNVSASEDCANGAVPGSYSNTVSVAATNRQDVRSSGSCRGSSVTFSSPGEDIATAVVGSADTFVLATGTSFATPLVSGAASLLRGLDPSLTQDELIQILKTTAVDLGAIGRDVEYGWGRLNLAEAVALIFADDFESGSVSRWTSIGQ